MSKRAYARCCGAGRAGRRVGRLPRDGWAQTPTPGQGGDCCVAPQRHRLRRLGLQQLRGRSRSAVRDSALGPVLRRRCDRSDCADAVSLRPDADADAHPGRRLLQPARGTGCDVGDCQACVCGGDPTCCNMIWDATCVAEASMQLPGDCPCTAPPTETPAPTPTPGGDCCSRARRRTVRRQRLRGVRVRHRSRVLHRRVGRRLRLGGERRVRAPVRLPGAEPCCGPHDSVSCDDVRCKTCVCDLDAACCTDAWDQRCVDEATVDCQIDCTCDSPGGCCARHDGIGCEEQTCQDCVCALDEPCCSDVWDPTLRRRGGHRLCRALRCLRRQQLLRRRATARAAATTPARRASATSMRSAATSCGTRAASTSPRVTAPTHAPAAARRRVPATATATGRWGSTS